MKPVCLFLLLAVCHRTVFCRLSFLWDWMSKKDTEKRIDIPEEFFYPNVRKPQFPSHINMVVRRFPETMFVSLMRNHCEKKYGLNWHFFCDDNLTSCTCYDPTYIAVDSVIHPKEKEKGMLGYTFVGVPYSKLPDALYQNFISSTKHNTCQSKRAINTKIKYQRWKSSASQATKHTIEDNVFKNAIENYKEEYLRGENGKRKIKAIFDAYKTNPVCARHSNMYYKLSWEPHGVASTSSRYSKFIDDEREIKGGPQHPSYGRNGVSDTRSRGNHSLSQNSNAVVNMIEDTCRLCSSFRKRHNIDICGLHCADFVAANHCDRNLEGEICKPAVQTRFYVKEDTPFYLPIDRFTYSSTFGVYLGGGTWSCGTDDSFKHGVHHLEDVKSKGLKVMEEIVKGHSRVFKTPLFKPGKGAKKYNICVCSHDVKGSDSRTCMHQSEYTEKYGEVIIIDHKEELKQVEIDHVVTVSETDVVIIHLNSKEDISDCYALFDIFQYNWHNGDIKRLPSYGKHINVVTTEEKDATTVKLGNPGIHRICLVDKQTFVVKQLGPTYNVRGLIEVSGAVIYHNLSNALVSNSLVLRYNGISPADVEYIKLVEAADSCKDKSIGAWAPASHQYYSLDSSKDQEKWVAHNLSLNIVEKDLARHYKVCVKYVGKEQPYSIGVAVVRPYIDSWDGHMPSAYSRYRALPNDIHNLVISRNSNLMQILLRNIFNQHETPEKTGLMDEGYFQSFMGDSEEVILHFRAYTFMNMVTVSLMTEENPLFYPLRTMEIHRPKLIRAAIDEGAVVLYVLNRHSKLEVYPVFDSNTFMEKHKATRVAQYPGEMSSMDLVYHDRIVKVIGVSRASSCLVLCNRLFTSLGQLCNTAGTPNIIAPGRIACVRGLGSLKESHCFLAMPLTNQITWITVNHVNNKLTYTASYSCGDERDNLGFNLGPPSSITSFWYQKGERDTIGVIFTRENDLGMTALEVHPESKTITFAFSIPSVASGAKLRALFAAFSSGKNKSVIAITEDCTANESYVSMDRRHNRGEMKRVDSSRWGVSFLSLDALIKLPPLNYDIPQKLVLGKSYVVPLTFKNDLSIIQNGIKYYIEAVYTAKDDVISRIVSVNSEGTLTIQSTSLALVRFEVVQQLLWFVRRRLILLNFICPAGMFYNGKDCEMCPIGTYNPESYDIEDVMQIFKCRDCPPNESTLSVGAVSVNQCLCKPGYTLMTNIGNGPRCQPCPPGTFKSSLGPDRCIATCSLNSYSTVVGSSSGAGLFCKCYPGYYLSGGDCLPCEEGYFCLGGYKARQQKCPMFTTTKFLAAKTVEDCVCIPGYEPAFPDRIELEGTFENKLAKKIAKKYNVTDNHEIICVPCSQNEYKVAVGPGRCVLCPYNTYSTKSGNTSESQCNRCSPGYYETNDPSNPCEICPPNSICVGSDPTDPKMKIYSGKRLKCHKNSITLPPYDENTSLNDCLCESGHSVQIRSGVIKCEPVPKNTYKDVIGNVGPTECPNGSYTLKAGATSPADCVCEKGLYFDDVNKSCAICPVGKYCLGGRNDTGDHVLPMECKDANAITTVAGASSESDCLCKQGYHQTPDSDGSCVPCPANTYKSYISNDQCTKCEEHSSTVGKIGATSKEHCVCGPGYYFDRTCKACGYRDKYCPGGFVRKRDSSQSEDIYETHAPISCPVNTEIPPGVDTADSVESCKCGKGYAFVKKSDDTNEKICVPCSPGSYKSSVMDSSCNGLCTQNATSLPGAQNSSQCFCNRGYYYLAGGICAPCVEGAKCDGGLINMENGNLIKRDVVVSHNDHVKPVPIEGYYLDKISPELRKPDDWRFIKCPIKGACLGEEGCSESMTEYLCAECKRGYTNNFKKGALCNKCPNIGTNLLLTVAWYLGLLLVNIVMACLNVSAGFNRRSIHSVVIKIALNYGICMSVLNVINFSELALPEELKSISLRWFKIMYRESKEYHTSIDCLIQEWFGLKHADSFFYTMLFIACLPVILLVVVTVLMWVILELFKIKRHSITRSKLALLHQSRVQGMQYLSERLCNEYSNERLFLIFRYIPLPGETRWVRFKHFLEDMIPIYVTVLFSVHGNTTSQMLSLLDCTCITLGHSIQSKYVLRPAMSIKCSLDPSMGYIPYLLLGLGGLVFWGFGIPFFSYLVLLMNRKNLYAPDVRMKYGFLHNGYQQDYWFWEAIVFTRKSLVLVIGSIVIVPSQNVSGSRIWMALAVAVIFLVIQLIYKPFDERDYFVLGRLESHSMVSWTANLLAVSLMCYLTLTPMLTSVICAVLLINSTYFCYKVTISFVSALLDTMKQKGNKRITGKMSWIANALFYLEFRRKLHEPMITYSQENSHLQLKLHGKRRGLLGNTSTSLKTLEYYYFTKIVAELYRIAVCRLKLDIIPRLFIEFLLRLSISITKFEGKMAKRELFRDLADGDLSRLIAWAAENECRRLNKIVKLDHVNGESIIPNVILDDESLIASVGLRRDELQYIMDCLFDDKVLMGKTNLSDFYHSLTRVWIMDTAMLTFLFTAFKHVKAHRYNEAVMVIENSNFKLERIKSKLIKVLEDEVNAEYEKDESPLEMEKRLQALIKEQEELQNMFKKIQVNPDSYILSEDAEKGGINLNFEELGFTFNSAMKNYLTAYDSSSEGESDSDETYSSSEESERSDGED